MLLGPIQILPHSFLGGAVFHARGGIQRAFPHPVPAPPVTLVRVGGVLEAVTAQRVQHFVLDRLDGGREIRDQMVRVAVQADHHGVAEECGELFIRAAHREQVVVHARQKILLETANGTGGAEDGFADSGFIEAHEGAVAALHLDDPVLHGHALRMTALPLRDNQSGLHCLSRQLLCGWII
jgi:hypothetical protein